MLFAYGPADANASQNPIISHLIQIQTGFTFLVPDYPGRPGKRPLNGCLSVARPTMGHFILCRDQSLKL